MENFAEYILNEKSLDKKIEIVYYLQKKENIFLDISVIFKTVLANLFLQYEDLEADINTILTACLLYACKKVDNCTDLEQIKVYAKNGAEYLSKMGFNEKFCNICEGVNRYNPNLTRENESDILELVDNFGGMLLHRPERPGFPVDEALILLEHRNLKEQNNIYLDKFIMFVNELEKDETIEKANLISYTFLTGLVKKFNSLKNDNITGAIGLVNEVFK